MRIAVVNLITRTPTKHKVPPIDSNKDAMIVKLALEIQAHGHEVVLYVSDLYKPMNNEDFGLEVVYLKTHFRWLPELPFVPSLIGQLRKNYDIILTSEAFQWATIFAVLAQLSSLKCKPKIFVWQELAIHQRALWRLPSIFFHQILLRFLLDLICHLNIICQSYIFKKRKIIHSHIYNLTSIKSNYCSFKNKTNKENYLDSLTLDD